MYMKKLFILIPLIYLFGSCDRESNKSIEIYFENNSGLDTSLIIDTYLNGSIYKPVTVRRDSQKTYDTSIKAFFKLKKNEDLQLMFISKLTHDSTNCTILNQQIDSVYYIHVNLVTTVFQKGFTVFNKVLEKDSVAYHSFYCEIIPKKHL